MILSPLRISGSLPMGAGAERVWAVFGDVGGWRRWDWMGSADARWLHGEPWAVGSGLRVGHRPFTFDCVVTHAEPGRRVSWEGGGLWFRGHHTFTFESLGPGECLVRTTEVFTGRGARLLKPLIRWFWAYQLAALRRACAGTGDVPAR